MVNHALRHDLFEAGKTDSEAAEILGITTNNYRQWRNNNNLYKRKQKKVSNYIPADNECKSAKRLIKLMIYLQNRHRVKFSSEQIGRLINFVRGGSDAVSDQGKDIYNGA